MSAPPRLRTLRPNTPHEQRRAGITCGCASLNRDDPHHDLAELLRALGLKHDPDALDRTPLSKTRTRRGDME